MKKILTILTAMVYASYSYALFESTSRYCAPPTKALACFFLSSPGMIRNDQDLIINRYKTFEREPLRNFEQNFMSDAILHAFIKALCLKEKHIFISYSTWENYHAFAQLIRSRLREIGVTEPEQQLYVPKNKRNGAIFYSPSPIQQNNTSLTDKKKRFKQSLRNLPARWAELVIPLFMFDPNDWYIYDTHCGLYYLTPCQGFNVNQCPVNINAMQAITNTSYMSNRGQNKHAYIYTVRNALTGTYFDIDYSWTEKLATFLKNTTQWHTFFIGHGWPYNRGFESNILGMPAKGGRMLFEHLNNQVKPKAAYMSSCYWHPQRIIALLNGRNDTKTQKGDIPFNFEFVTAASGHYPALEYDSEICVSRYRPDQLGKKLEFSLVKKDTSTYELARKTTREDSTSIRTTINNNIKEFKTVHYDISPALIMA